MSTSVGLYGVSGASTILSKAIGDITERQTQVSWEASEGTISETIAGLDDNTESALSLSPRISEISSLSSNITVAQSRLSLTSSAYSSMASLAQNLAAAALSMESTEGSSRSAVDANATTASADLSTLAGILNTSDENGYIFSGINSTEKTVTDPDGLATSNLATKINSIVSGLTSSNAETILSEATDAAADNSDSLTVFSASLSVPAEDAGSMGVSIVTGIDGQTTQIGAVATQGSQKTSDSTGSPVRDLIRDMMIMSSMKGMSYSTPGFTEIASQLQKSLTKTANSLIDAGTSTGVLQDQLTSKQSNLTNVQNLLESQMDMMVGANMAEAATQASDLKTQLEASFTLISHMKDMTLANYI